MTMLRAFCGIIIVTAALCVASAHAQKERSDDQRPAMKRPPAAKPKATAAADEWCRSYRLTAIDEAVCADWTLVDKHYQVVLMQRSLQTLVGFPRTLRFEQLHRAWLND